MGFGWVLWKAGGARSIKGPDLKWAFDVDIQTGLCIIAVSKIPQMKFFMKFESFFQPFKAVKKLERVCNGLKKIQKQNVEDFKDC